MELVRPDFYLRAACRGADPELFFDPDYEAKGPLPEVYDRNTADARTRRKMARRAAARSYCQRCPVIEECLEIGWNASDGMFGGYDKDERKHLLRQRRKAQRAAEEAAAAAGQEQPDESLSVREKATQLFKRGKGVRQVMDLTGLDYQMCVTLRNRVVMDADTGARWQRPEPPRNWGVGVECYFFSERHWVGGQYLGEQERAGELHMLVQTRRRGQTVRKWCKATDVTLRPDVPRYPATRHSRKDLDVVA